VMGTYTGVEILCSISSSKSQGFDSSRSHKTTIMINITLLLKCLGLHEIKMESAI